MADRRRRRRRASQDSEDDDESGSGSDSGRSGSPATKARGREPDPAEPTVSRSEAKSDVESEFFTTLGSVSFSCPLRLRQCRSRGKRFPLRGKPDRLPVDLQAGFCSSRSIQLESCDDFGLWSSWFLLLTLMTSMQESTDDPETKAGGKPGQQLDDDEDRKNPAYIPRKGLFFEHDVRGQTQEEERPKGRNRKLWKDEGRWEHDRFREEEQAPKSRAELIAIYGYDIRNGGGIDPGERAYRQRRPRQSSPSSRDKRWRDGQRPARSWQNRGAGAPPPSSVPPPSSSAFPSLSAVQQSNNSSRPPPSRSRPPYHNQTHPSAQSVYRNNESNAPQVHPRERHSSKVQLDTRERGGSSRGGRGHGGRGGSSVVIEEVSVSQSGAAEDDPRSASTGTAATVQPGGYQSPRRQEQRGSADRAASGSAASTSDPALQSSAANPEASPPTERPVERKSYSLARRTRSRPSDLGSKQASVEESAAGATNSSPSSGGGKNWAEGGDGASQTGGGGVADLDQEVARLNLARQNWSQSPTSYLRSEMRGLPNPIHMASGPPQYSNMEEMGVGSNRAKRYSSQRQRAVPEPAPPMHLGVMEGHYFEPMSYQGPIYTHGEGPAPIPPQGMLVQPEMHIPHPGWWSLTLMFQKPCWVICSLCCLSAGLHPHQSGGPIANPTLYGAPPVSLSPGQPQQLLPPPFYPPPGVMTFPYPAMYPSPQVTYGGVTYYDTMQQQAQPKPSPPRRTSQPVTVKPPPPEVPFASE
ncbi:hypothetical protein GOODEAATRI_003748 [Goodea atripinnis]|uniref:Protein CASC3 n=1 Tax=Goodea atripinnis TaxID=208336 RepID=A0ABV0P4V6_9TELE